MHGTSACVCKTMVISSCLLNALPLSLVLTTVAPVVSQVHPQVFTVVPESTTVKEEDDGSHFNCCGYGQGLAWLVDDIGAMYYMGATYRTTSNSSYRESNLIIARDHIQHYITTIECRILKDGILYEAPKANLTFPDMYFKDHCNAEGSTLTADTVVVSCEVSTVSVQYTDTIKLMVTFTNGTPITPAEHTFSDHILKFSMAADKACDAHVLIVDINNETIGTTYINCMNVPSTTLPSSGPLIKTAESSESGGILVAVIVVGAVVVSIIFILVASTLCCCLYHTKTKPSSHPLNGGEMHKRMSELQNPDEERGK